MRKCKGRSAKGIKGMELAPSDEIVSLSVIDNDKYKKNLKHKIAVSKIKSLLSKEFKTLTPQIELSGFLSIKLLFFNITKKVRIKFKYYLLNKFTD